MIIAVIAPSLDVAAIGAISIITGVLMLAYVVRGVPKSRDSGSLQGDVVLVATKSKKKSKGSD